MWIPLRIKWVSFIFRVEKRIYHDDMIFENEIRTELVRIISEGRVQSSPQIVQLAADLANGMLTLEELYHKMKRRKSTGTKQNDVCRKEFAYKESSDYCD